MPAYDYKCPECGNIEEKILSINQLDIQWFACEWHTIPVKMNRIISSSGATHGDEAPWIESTTEFIKDGEPETLRYDPVKSRTEFKKLLKEKGLEPVG